MAYPANTPTQNAKINAIQIIRAIAIIAVVIIHTTPSGIGQVICRPFLNFAVATFLFLSGYLTKAENDDWKAFYKKRITRVIIPYIIWSILCSLPAVYKKGIETLIINLVTANASAVMYYIFVYIQFVLLTPLLGRLAKSKYRTLGWFVAPVSLLIFKYYFLLTGTELSTSAQIIWGNSCLGWFTFYYLGLLLGNKIIEVNYRLETLSFLYVISLFLQIAEGYGWFLLGDTNCGTQMKLTTLVTSTIFLLIVHSFLRKKKDYQNRFLRLTGDYSFGIYLSHLAILVVLQHTNGYSLLPYPVNSLVVLLISLGCCYIGDKVLGRRISNWLGLR